ncbi:MAG: riboflavin synthase [Solirubrobacteraceae bacterium]
MFTGLVAALGSVAAVEPAGDGSRLTIAAGDLARELAEGDSVAVNGVCLTAVAIDGDRFTADVVAETLRRSSLGPLHEGAAVNLELPLRATDRLGGHVVQGHVDGVGLVVASQPGGLGRRIRIEAGADLLRYIVEKGSIAVDGVSLTVAEVDESGFAVALIPETLQRTTLGGAEPGRRVNVEVDVLAKYVEKLVPSSVGPV